MFIVDYPPKVSLKLCYGMKARHARKYLRGRDAESLKHGLALKPGDIIQSCDGFNHRIKSIKYYYEAVSAFGFGSGKRGHFLREIRIFDDEDRVHVWGSCAGPAATVEQITNSLKLYVLDDARVQKLKSTGWWLESSEEIRRRLLKGLPICDEYGFKIKEDSNETY